MRLKTESKYRSKKTTIDGHQFDSKREADYYAQLKILKQAGKISAFELQPRYEIVEGYRHPVTGKKVQATHYVADFLVTHTDGRQEVVDVKSEATKTPLYRLKKKLFEKKYGIGINEVI